MKLQRFLDMKPDEMLYYAARGYLWVMRPVMDLGWHAAIYVTRYERRGQRHLKAV